MTFVAGVSGFRSLWMVADRRLSVPGRTPIDDARKMIFLETTDGTAILGYTGLGATIRGTEPSDWMNATLRGVNLPLEQCLGFLSRAMYDQLPVHLARIPKSATPAHTIVINAICNKEPRVYSIDMVLSKDRKKVEAFRYAKHAFQVGGRILRTPPRLIFGGSGAISLLAGKVRWDWRFLQRLIRAHDRGLIHSLTVADELAKLNFAVHQATSDKSVGPRCIIAWRMGKKAKFGSAHQCYNGIMRENVTIAVPTIAQGMDVMAIMAALLPPNWPSIKPTDLINRSAEDIIRMNTALSQVPTKPDTRLR